MLKTKLVNIIINKNLPMENLKNKMNSFII